MQLLYMVVLMPQDKDLQVMKEQQIYTLNHIVMEVVAVRLYFKLQLVLV